MYETQVTVVGNLLTDVDGRRLNDGTAVANFRVASKERRFDRAVGTWVDGDRLYVEVRCWRGLAQNAMASLKKGDPVVVTGRLFTRNYEYQGQRRTSTTLDARSVAADLSQCTVVLTRTRSGSADVHSADTDRTAGTADDNPAGDGREGAHGWGTAGETPSGGAGNPVEPDGAGPQLVAVAPGDEG